MPEGVHEGPHTPHPRPRTGNSNSSRGTPQGVVRTPPAWGLQGHCVPAGQTRGVDPRAAPECEPALGYRRPLEPERSECRDVPGREQPFVPRPPGYLRRQVTPFPPALTRPDRSDAGAPLVGVRALRGAATLLGTPRRGVGAPEAGAGDGGGGGPYKV